MPVEIKELVIRAIVQDPDASPAKDVGFDEDAQAAMVQACVTQVLRILKSKEER